MDIELKTIKTPAGANSRLARGDDEGRLEVVVVSGGSGGGASDTTEATQLLVKAAVESINTETGALTETAPATDTASSGLNGRLQRIAQRLTSLIALIPTSLGQGTMATSMKVVLPSDQGSIPVAATLSAETTKVIGTINNAVVSHSATVTVTRPADTTAYTAGDVIGDTGGSAIMTFANMGKAAGGEVMITSVELELDVATSAMAGTKLRLYNAAPTAIADNAAWDLVSGDRGKYLGQITLSTPTDEGSTLFCDNDGINKQITLASGSLYAELQTVSAFTPASAIVKRITIHTIEV
ncbi:MAG: hypothetical protein WC856_13680 [Methylococcaceae bacterium]